MKALLLCAFLTTAAFVQAHGLSQEGVTDAPKRDVGSQAGDLPLGQERLIIAQTAVEYGQLVPREKPEVAPPKTVRKPSRSTHGRSRARASAPVRDYKPAPIKSRFQSNAEQFAKANGCAAPVTKMNYAITGSEAFETFTATCASKAQMSIRCDSAQCRTM